MKFVLALFLAVLLLAPVMRAQDTSSVARIEIVTKQQPVKLKNFYTIRAGLWFPKDMEKEFKINDVTYKGTADRSQAFGLDFHFRNNIGHPLYFDVSVSGWFSSYDYKTSELDDNIQDVSSWTAIIPITFGLSISTPTESLSSSMAWEASRIYCADRTRYYRRKARRSGLYPLRRLLRSRSRFHAVA